NFSITDYLVHPHATQSLILPEWRAAIGAPGLILLLGALLAVGLAMRGARGGRLAPGAAEVLALGAVAFLIACIYVFTAGSAQGNRGHPFPGLVAANSRYLMPAIILAAAATAWATTRLRRTRIVLELLALASIANALLSHPRESPAGIVNPSLRGGSVALI